MNIHLQNKELYSKLYNDINKFIQLKYKNKEFINFDQILNELNMSYETYILRSTTRSKNQKYNFIDSIQTKPNIIDNSELIKLINSLNCKQYEFFLYIMQQQLHNEINKH